MKSRLALLLIALASLALAGDPMRHKFGEWQLNSEKSTFAAGSAPRSDVRVYKDRGGGVIMSTHTTIDAGGREGLTIYAAKFDGKDYPVVTRGSGAVSRISFKVIDRYSESFVLTRDGKIANRGTTVISKDGRTLTMTMTSTNAAGQNSSSVSVYEKK